jgi:hypothetical protein
LTEEPARLVDAVGLSGFDVLKLDRRRQAENGELPLGDERSALREATGDCRAFLHRCRWIDIAPCDDGSFQRLHQLLLKTNRFHLTLSDRPKPSGRRRVALLDRLRDRWRLWHHRRVEIVAARCWDR